jgi:glycosyltransferase involved in cell wall biosynthesis
MRVGINALLCGHGQNYRRTGVSRYVDKLLGPMGSLASDLELTAYVDSKAAAAGWPNVSLRPSRVPVANPAARIAWEMTALPLQTRQDNIDIFHGTVNTLPYGLRAAKVVTVHDLAFMRFPNQVTKKRYHYLKFMVGSSVRRADLVLTPSEATRRDVAEFCGIDADRVVVTPLGVDPGFQPPSLQQVTAIRERFGLVRPYILTVGTIEPRKNLARLVQAFAQVSGEFPHDLVLVGPEGWLMDEIEGAIATSGIAERVRRIGFADDAALVALYGGADAVAMPSLYEGFGLPLLEAMASGAPVLTSNVSALPEVAGEAAELVDPTSVESIAEGLSALLGSESRRDSLRRFGLERAAQFTWDRTAALTVAGYQRVAT